MPKVPLNDLPRQKLCEIVDTYGRYIYDDPQRCKGLLLDYCAEYRREINILMNALEEQVVAELLVSATRESYEGMLSRLAWRLCENYGLAEDFARWGVESWALALGIISEETFETLDAVETEPKLEKKNTPEWRAIGTSVRGEVHIRENLPNQDYISWQQNGETDFPLVLAVADGHGDEQYFRSAMGAKFAVEVALHILEGFCSTINATTSQDIVKDLPLTIVAKWKEKVEAHWQQNRLTEEETKWLAELKDTTIQQSVKANHTLPYGTTLLAAMVTETCILYLQLGNGDILTILETGKVTRPESGDKWRLVNKTTSLCSATAVHDFRSYVQMRSNEQPALILLSTDGYANSYRDEAGFLKVGTDILNMMRVDGVDAVAARMRGWLKTATRTASGDDITLGILCRMSALEQKDDTTDPTALQAAQIEEAPSPRSVRHVENKTESKLPRDVKGTTEIVISQIPDVSKRATTVIFRPVLIVSQDRTDDNYTSINAAIKDAEPGTRIEVQPGTYNEGIIINKDGLEISGVGPKEKIIITSKTSACLRVRERGSEIKRAKIRNLTLRGSSKREKDHAVRLHNGQLLIEECDITSASSACVYISGPRADHTLRNCIIHDGAGCGILISNNAKGTVEDCDVYGNTDAGVSISEYATPIIRRCNIYNGKGSGIVVSEKEAGSNLVPLNEKDRIQILECNIFENVANGLEIHQVESSPKSEPLVQECSIHDNKGNGIFVDNGGRGTVEECKIFHNASAALAEVEIGKDGKLTLQRSEVYDGQKCGVLIHDEGQGQLEACEIFCNTEAGVEIKKQGNIILKESFIKYGRKNGLWVHENGQGTLENCSIYGNEAAGVKIQMGNLPINIYSCKIYDSNGSGVLIYDKGKEKTVVIEGCDVFKNANGGVEIRREADPTICYCNIYQGKGSGILAYENSKGHVHNTNIYENAYVGIAIKQSTLCIEECQIHDNAYQGITVSEQGKLDLKNCEVIENKGGPLQVQAKCRITLNGRKLKLTNYIVLFIRSLGMIRNR